MTKNCRRTVSAKLSLEVSNDTWVSHLGTTFVYGGIHPRFGSRNSTTPLFDGKYIEVVCSLDHPGTEETQWGNAV
jgi:hypothetical protein